MNNIQPLIDRFQIHQRRKPGDVMGMNFNRFPVAVRHDSRHNGARPLWRHDAAHVVQNQAIHVGTGGQLFGAVGIEPIGVDWAYGIHQRQHHFGIVFLGDLGEAMQLVEVAMQRIVYPETAYTVLAEATYPQVHQRVGRHRHGDDAVATQPSTHAHVGHGLHDQVQSLPGIFVGVAHHDFEHGTADVIDDGITGFVHQWRDGQRHAGLHAHAPQALLAVAQGLVDDFDMGHVCLTLQSQGESGIFDFKITSRRRTHQQARFFERRGFKLRIVASHGAGLLHFFDERYRD